MEDTRKGKGGGEGAIAPPIISAEGFILNNGSTRKSSF